MVARPAGWDSKADLEVDRPRSCRETGTEYIYIYIYIPLIVMDIFLDASDFLQNPGNGWFGPRWVLLVRREAPGRPTEIVSKNVSKKATFLGHKWPQNQSKKWFKISPKTGC